MANLLTKLNQLVDATLESKIAELKKSAQPQVPQGEELIKKVKEDGTIGRKGMIFDPFSWEDTTGGVWRQRRGYLSNHLLKLVARRDPIVSTIINIRAQQVQAFCRPQHNRFDAGFKITAQDNETPNQDEIRTIQEYLLNCGTTVNRSIEDKMTFDQFGYMVARDWLVYGHAAIEKVPSTDAKKMSMFIPLAAESIFYANKKVDKHYVKAMRDAWRRTIDEKEGNYIDAIAAGEYEYIQVLEGRVVEGFTTNEMVFSRIWLESDIDLNGYAIGPLEKAVNMITAHMKIENHQQSFFTHGVASKGLLVIQGDVTPNTLRTLQAQWTQQVTGGMNAWRTPILAGIKGVQWQPLTMGNRDMEYAAYQDHVIRTIHACFNIDPEETGFGYLSRGTDQKSLSESSNEWKATKSIDKGLRPILSRMEALINEDILPAWNKDYSKRYKFCFVGLDAETRGEELSRLSSEVSLHTSLNEAREEAELEPLEIGGGLILNAVLLDVLQRNMPKGLFMEKFLGLQGYADRPDLQYVADPLWFQWQQLQMSLMAPPTQGSAPEKDSKDTKEASDKDQEASRQAEAQEYAVQSYIMANPSLFKGLLKSEVKDLYSQKTAELMEAEYLKGSRRLLQEILQSVKEETSGGPEEEDDS